MKKPVLYLLPLLVLTGCATSGQMQKMIEANNQKIAAEQLKPEFDRIDEQLTQTEESLAALQESVSEEQSRTASQIKDISLVLNTVQADLSVVQRKMEETLTAVTAQRDDVREARRLVETQRDALLKMFREQQAQLTEMISDLTDETTPTE
jgi:chromosome segregation ATPase